MKIIYYGSSDTKIPVVVGLVHLGVSMDELHLKLTELDLNAEELSFLGEDKYGNQVLAFGGYGQEKIIKRMLLGLKRIFKLESEILFINTGIIESFRMKLARILLKVGFKSLSEYIIKREIKLNYQRMKRLVKKN